MKAMYKILALLFVLIIGMNSTATADNNNYLSVENFTAEAGSQVVMPIMMTNSEQIAAFQADLYLPSGVTLAEDEFGDGLIEIAIGRTTSKRHTVSYKAQPDGAIRIVVTSPNNNVFSGTSGAVVNITLAVANSISSGTHTIMLNNQELTKTDLTAYKTATKSATITVASSNILVSSITFDKTALSIVSGQTASLTATVAPADATNKNLIWTSSATSVATVSNGTITAIAPGTATITATAADGSGVNATCEVTVTKDLSAEIAALQTLVASAQATCTNAVEGTAVGNYNSGAKAALQSVINEVSATISASMTEAQITEGTRKINDALATFETEKVTEKDEPSFVEPTDISTFDNVLYVNEFETRSGEEFVLPISLKNKEENVVGFQFSMEIPQGLLLARNVRGKIQAPVFDAEEDRTSTEYHVINASEQADGSIMVLCYSNDNEIILGNDGVLCNFTGTVSEDMQEGEYNIILRDIVITYDNLQQLEIDRIVSKVVIANYIPGDVNDDKTVNVTDIATTASHILGNKPSPFIEKAADVNEDSKINVTDLAVIANMILNKNTAKSKGFFPQALVTDDDKATLKIIPFQVAQGTTSKTVTLDLLGEVEDEFVGFQCELLLPEGFGWTLNKRGKLTAPTFNVEAERTDAEYHIAGASLQDDGKIVVLCYSNTNEVILGKEGAVLDLPLTIDASVPSGLYEIKIDGMVLTRSDLTQLTPKAYTLSVLVGAPEIADVKLSGDFSEIDMTPFLNTYKNNINVESIDLTEATALPAGTTIPCANPNALIMTSTDLGLTNSSNVVIGEICQNLSLVDKMPFAAPKAFTATTATYSRTLPDGEGWNSAVLPYEFDVTADMEVINNAVINGSSINFSEVATGETIPANTPFLYRKVGGGTITIENVDVEIAPQETTPTSGALLGTYVKIPVGEATGKFIMTQDGMGFATASALASIPAFRAYLNGGASSQVFTIVVGDEVTGMISADANVNEKVDVYTIDGKLIRTQVEAITALQGLENGTYIINGNKIKK